MDQPIKVALLGATGKAGQYILTALLNKGYQVKALIRQPDDESYFRKAPFLASR